MAAAVVLVGADPIYIVAGSGFKGSNEVGKSVSKRIGNINCGLQ